MPIELFYTEIHGGEKLVPKIELIEFIYYNINDYKTRHLLYATCSLGMIDRFIKYF